MASNVASFLLLLVSLSAVPVTPMALEWRVPGFAGRGRRQSPESESQQSGGGSDVVSPCPEVLSNIRINRNRGRWTALVTASAEEEATGVIFEIQLDRRADIIGTSFGEVATNDNMIQTIRDDNLRVTPGQLIGARFFVKYNVESDPPRVRAIKFNGKQICPTDEDPPPPPETSTQSTSTQSVTFTNPTSPAMFAPIVSTNQNGDGQVTQVATSSPQRRPPDDSTSQDAKTDLYEIKGEFKVYSNASLLVLLVARPPKRAWEGSAPDPQNSDELDDLLAKVFNVSGGSVVGGGSTSPGSGQRVQVLRNGAEDEDEPPFTSAVAPSPPVPGMTPRGQQGGGGEGGGMWASPCPGIFSYLSDSSGSNAWHGGLTLNSRDHLVGIRLDIELDKPSLVLGAWLGEATSEDDINFTIWNPSAEIRSGETIIVRIFAKYARDDAEPPRIRSIRFNGRQICPAG